MVSERDIETLVRMGLTTNQARVYFALLHRKKASAKTIYKDAQIDRGDTYRVIYQLQDLGLIEKILDTPNNYIAMPLHEGLSKLLKQKTHEFRQLKSDAKELMTQNNFLHKNQPQADQDQFVMIPPMEMHFKKFRASLSNAQISLDSLYFWTDLKRTIENGARAHKKALKKGAKIRYLVEEIGSIENTSKVIEPLTRLGNFEARFLPKLPRALFAIVDRKELFIVVSPTPPTKSSCLWSSNLGVIEIFQSYFDKAWEEAKNQVTASV
jgi:sugar-specific transcriptional regulator TrmB